ncbi:unnamed protein product [Closterium sp. NIES-53]
MSADKLSAHAIPCVFLGFPPDAPAWQFYRPTSRRVLPSQDVTFDESVPFYNLFPYHSAPLPPPLLFLAPGPPLPHPGTVPVEVAVDLGAARGAASGVTASGGVELARAEPEVAEPAGAECRGAEFEGAGSGGAEPGGAGTGGGEPGGAEPGGAQNEGAEPRGAVYEGMESGGAERRDTASSRGPAGASPQLSPRPEPLSPQQLREWFARRTRLRSGAVRAGDSAAGGTGAGGTGAISLGSAGVLTGAGGPGGAKAAGPVGARTRGTGAVGAGGGTVDIGAGGAAGVGAAGVGTGDPGAGAAGGTGAAGPGGARTGGTEVAGAGGTARVGAGDPGVGDTGAGSTGPGGAGAIGAKSGDTGRPRSKPPLQPASPLPASSPYTEQTTGLTEHREPVSRPASPVRAVRTGRRVPRQCPPPVPGTHHMALRPSSVLQRVPLPSPLASSLADGPDFESDLVRAASPTVPRLLATVITDPSFESPAASALMAELVDFAAVCRLDYAASLVVESESVCPPSAGGECALRTDVLEDRQEDFECFVAAVPHLVSMLIALEGDPDAPDILTTRSYAEAITGPYSSQWQTAMDAEMATWKSTGTYVDEIPPPGANIVDGMWIFRVKWPLGSPPAFKARYVARGFS